MYIYTTYFEGTERVFSTVGPPKVATACHLRADDLRWPLRTRLLNLMNLESKTKNTPKVKKL